MCVCLSVLMVVSRSEWWSNGVPVRVWQWKSFYWYFPNSLSLENLVCIFFQCLLVVLEEKKKRKKCEDVLFQLLFRLVTIKTSVLCCVVLCGREGGREGGKLLCLYCECCKSEWCGFVMMQLTSASVCLLFGFF